MSWSAAETDEIIESMRAGATVMVGGSRCHTTHGFRDGAWVSESFDEGYTEDHPSSEASIRSMIARDPEAFQGILKLPRWRRFSEAFMTDDPQARVLLDAALVYGDPLEEGRVLAAFLAWPSHPPSPDVVALITEKVGGFTAYHVFMGAAGWDHSVATARRGIAFVDRLREMVGDVLGVFALRACFHERAGDRVAAERDLLRELERAPVEDWRRPGWEQSLVRLRAAGPLEL